jgi:oxazoline/thiazoline synthase
VDPAESELVGFKRHLRVETVPAEAVYLVSERGVTVLSGPCVERLAPLLDGTRSRAQLTRELSPELAAAEVKSALGRMSDADLIDLCRPPDPGADVAPDAPAAAFWALAGQHPDEAASAISAGIVEIVALGDVGSTAAAAACAESGLACCEPGTADATVSLVLCDDYLDVRLQAVNARHLASGHPWLLARPAGAEAWIGPMFRPGAGPCWACLATRLEGSRDEAHLLRRVLGSRAFPAAPQASLPASRTAAVQLAVLEVAKWLAGIRTEEQQAIYILDLLSLRGGHHAVHRRPQCARCGTPGMIAARAGRRPAVIRAASWPAASGRQGGRQAGPERVLKDYGHLVDPVTGIVPELRRDERCPVFQHSFVSGRNRALAASTVAGLRAVSRHPNGGRGVTEQEAKVSALCEAIERYSGTRQGYEPTIRGSLRSLRARAVHPNACLLFDQRQFDDRARWNTVCTPFHRVPEPFDDAAVIDWTPVWSLLTGEQRLLPTAMLYYQPRAEHGPASTPADSNGDAAGASLEDAIIRGFLELVERDAVALWWYNRTRQPGVCLRSFEDPWLAGLPERYERLGREVWALEVTSDLGIPVMAAITRRTADATEDIVYGFGAHFDPRTALRHALTELGQLLPAAGGAQAGRSGYGANDPHLVSWWTSATVANQPYLLPQPGQPARTAADYGHAAGGSPGLDGISAIARRAGLDILVLDQTRPDIRMPVAKVVVPGMRHLWPRFAPGRIFDVPVRLGRRPRPAEYSELNPVPVYVLVQLRLRARR